MAMYPDVLDEKRFDTMDELMSSIDTTNGEWWIGLKGLEVDVVIS